MYVIVNPLLERGSPVVSTGLSAETMELAIQIAMQMVCEQLSDPNDPDLIHPDLSAIDRELRETGRHIGPDGEWSVCIIEMLGPSKNKNQRTECRSN